MIAYFPRPANVLSVLLLATLSAFCRGNPEVVPLWPEKAPGAMEGIPAESWSHEVNNGKPYPRAENLENISIPTLTVFRPAPGKANGCAVVISPGGGYWLLAFVKEGTEIAEWFAERGVTAFVLKYRHRQHKHPIPLLDVTRAIRVVRSQAKEFGIDPNRIGAMGFSAGGHLTALAGTLYDSPEARAGDSLDSVSARPDFLVLVYSVLTLETPIGHSGSAMNLLPAGSPAEKARELSPVSNVTAQTPPTFLLASGGDEGVASENSVFFYLALRKHGVPAELHAFTRGPHGHGMRKGYGPIDVWPDLLHAWLGREGWLKQPN
ncbi:MAG: alpha/beta hydrolase [Opitutaceae bacterium]|nr:alpha/beta hydrolase [Opitutaceae bacterium]